MNEHIPEISSAVSETGEMTGAPLQRSQLPPSFSLAASPLQRQVFPPTAIQRNPRENYMELNPGSRTNHITDGGWEAIQQRLVELGYLEDGQFEWGSRDDATRDALRAFQAGAQGDALIDEVEADSQSLHDSHDVDWEGSSNNNRYNSQAQAGTGHRRGNIRDNDATHQALANAFPRRIFGAMVQNQAEAFALIQARVISRSLPFDPQAVNIVGVRAYQAGRAHTNEGSRLRLNQNNDTYFVLAMDESGEPMVREFRGTCDPGGRRGFNREPDNDRTQIMGADQQMPYRFFRTSPKYGRPMLGPQVGDAEHPQVIDPGRADMVENGTEFHYNEDEIRNGGTPLDLSERDDAYHSLRTVHGRDGDKLRHMGIAIHSGGGWNNNTTQGDSLACQVVHGDWYGNFIMTVRRGLTWARMRREELVPEDVRELDQQGSVIYSLLDASDFMETTGTAD